MIKLTGIADEAGASLDVQIKAHQELGWDSIESRGVELDGVKGNLHEIPEATFEKVCEKLAAANMKVSGFGSLIGNWAKKITDDFSITEAEIDRAIPRMQKLGAKLIRVMSYAVCKDENGKDLPEQHEAERIRRMREINQRFADAGLTVVHENCMNWGGMSPTLCEAHDGRRAGHEMGLRHRQSGLHRRPRQARPQAGLVGDVSGREAEHGPRPRQGRPLESRRRTTPITPTPAKAKARRSASWPIS